MKVIRKGRSPTERQAQWLCKRCKAVIQSKLNEGRYVNDQRDGDAVVTECPECGCSNWVAATLFRDVEPS